jgi:hypothetical protein
MMSEAAIERDRRTFAALASVVRPQAQFTKAIVFFAYTITHVLFSVSFWFSVVADVE